MTDIADGLGIGHAVEFHRVVNAVIEELHHQRKSVLALPEGVADDVADGGDHDRTAVDAGSPSDTAAKLVAVYAVLHIIAGHVGDVAEVVLRDDQITGLRPPVGGEDYAVIAVAVKRIAPARQIERPNIVAFVCHGASFGAPCDHLTVLTVVEIQVDFLVIMPDFGIGIKIDFVVGIIPIGRAVDAVWIIRLVICEVTGNDLILAELRLHFFVQLFCRP